MSILNKFFPTTAHTSQTSTKKKKFKDTLPKNKATYKLIFKVSKKL